MGRVRRVRLQGRRRPVFHWTQYAGHGPGPELLGDAKTVLEIGCGTGRALAILARQGIEARGLDLSPVMVKKSSERWADTGAVFLCGEVLEHLAECEGAYDAIYSIFGAAWFTHPGRLFPLVRQRLNPGGVFVFSQLPAIPGARGPQGMYKGGFAGKAMFSLPLQLPARPLGTTADPGRLRHRRGERSGRASARTHRHPDRARHDQLRPHTPGATAAHMPRAPR